VTVVVQALAVLVVSLIDSLAHLGGSLSIETMAQKLAHDSREELYVSLLGKSQTFHDRQRVGDVMARATDDVNQLDYMVHPGIFFIIEIVLGLVLPVVYIAFINPQLILVPVLFILVYIVTVRSYFRRLSPVIGAQRFAFGIMNAGLEETITGIEVVKGSARESFERLKFMRNAKAVRDYLVEQGTIEARYLPYLFYGFALGLSFLHTMILFGEGRLDCVDVVGKIKHERVVLPRVRPVETGERLHRLDARQRLVHVHRVKQGVRRSRSETCPRRSGSDRDLPECAELRQVNAVFAVVVPRTAAEPARAVSGRPLPQPIFRNRVAGVAGECRADQTLETALGRVGSHAVGSNMKRTPSWRSISQLFT